MTHQPLLMSLLAKKCKITNTKRTTQRTQGSSGHALIITSAPDADAPQDAASSPSEGNRQFFALLPNYNVHVTDHIIWHFET